MRKQRGDPPAVQPQQQASVVTEIRDYTLITPLIGGGAITGEPDEITVVRGTEIRGQLRFWWRACYGGRYSTIDEMKQAEGQIWGQASGKDALGLGFAETIQIVVEPIHRGNKVPAFRPVPGQKFQPDSDIPGYAAFPLRPTEREEKPSGSIYKNVRFRLTISFSVKKQGQDQPLRDILGTLWAWETFGGVGARTRRGFGALQLDKRIQKIGSTETGEKIEQTLPAPNATGILKWISEQFTAFGIDQKAPANVPSLSKNMLKEQIYVMGDFSSVKDTWKSLIEKLRAFRQDKQWPDSREIKKLRRAQSSSWKQEYRLPKAAIGLPIVFQLGKQADLTLQGAKEGYDRLASSLILRPLVCQNGRAAGLAILLENYPIYPETLQVMERIQGTLQAIPATIKTDRAADNVQMLEGESDVLKAFMNYLRRGNG